MQASRVLNVNQMQRLSARGRKLKGRGDRGKMSKMRASKVSGKSASSTRWLRRQLTDPYVQAAAASDRRARSAYKLMEIDDKERILWPGARVVEFGAAPGGWTEVAVERTSANNALYSSQVDIGGDAGDGQVNVVAFDAQPMVPVEGVRCVELAVGVENIDDVVARVHEATGSSFADVVLSDMAPHLCGDAGLDHERQVMLATLSFHLAQRLLEPNNERTAFLAKVSTGTDDVEFRQMLRDAFARVKAIKPPASRKQSREYYLLASHYKG
jgi:23S rRNA (uridine2552-2'-O)-methyltransferase